MLVFDNASCLLRMNESLYLYLQSCDKSNGKPAKSTQRHGSPEPARPQVRIGNDCAQLAVEENQWQEEYGGVQIVVVAKKPDLLVNMNECLLRLDGVHGKCQRAEHPEDGAAPRKVLC